MMYKFFTIKDIHVKSSSAEGEQVLREKIYTIKDIHVKASLPLYATKTKIHDI